MLQYNTILLMTHRQLPYNKNKNKQPVHSSTIIHGINAMCVRNKGVENYI